MTRTEILNQVTDEQLRVSLAHAAPYAVYRHALEQGWITQDQHDQARARYGQRWNYTGD